MDALARAEAAEVPAEAGLLHEVEEALEDDSGDAARRLLTENVGPSVLRQRLTEPR